MAARTYTVRNPNFDKAVKVTLAARPDGSVEATLHYFTSGPYKVSLGAGVAENCATKQKMAETAVDFTAMLVHNGDF